MWKGLGENKSEFWLRRFFNLPFQLERSVAANPVEGVLFVEGFICSGCCWSIISRGRSFSQKPPEEENEWNTRYLKITSRSPRALQMSSWSKGWCKGMYKGDRQWLQTMPVVRSVCVCLNYTWKLPVGNCFPDERDACLPEEAYPVPKSPHPSVYKKGTSQWDSGRASSSPTIARTVLLQYTHTHETRC